MPIYADAAEPDRIQELCDGMTDDSGNFIEGFNVLPADKAVSPGIDFVKSHPMKITKRSTNILNEIKKYMWKVGKDGKIVKDEPVKINDHAMDAGRYGEFTFGKVGSQGGPNIRNL
jgi:phage terminase large subunit